jgi:hypothetical protein
MGRLVSTAHKTSAMLPSRWSTLSSTTNFPLIAIDDGFVPVEQVEKIGFDVGEEMMNPAGLDAPQTVWPAQGGDVVDFQRDWLLSLSQDITWHPKIPCSFPYKSRFRLGCRFVR